MSGVGTINLINSSATGDTTFSGIQSIADVSVKGAGDATITYAATTVVGTADVQNLTVDTYTGTVSILGVETLNITTAGANSTLADLTATSATAVTVAGDKNLTITADTTTGFNAVTSIDASALTGKLNITSSDTSLSKFTGGSGDDTIDGATVVTKDDTIKGGAGSDTVSVSDASTAVDAEMVDFSNFEILDFTTASSTATLGTNFTAAGFTTIDATGASLALTAGATLGTAAAPLEITGYAFNNAAAKFVLGGTDDAADAATTGYSISSGIYTHTAGTATFSDFFAAIAATAAAGDVAGFVSGGSTYVFGEGANANATDDVFLKLTGLTATAISDANGTQAANTVFVA